MSSSERPHLQQFGFILASTHRLPVRRDIQFETVGETQCDQPVEATLYFLRRTFPSETLIVYGHLHLRGGEKQLQRACYHPARW
jgi:hypothetical protein